MSRENFNVYDRIDDLDQRIAALEKNMPDYIADLLEIGRNIGGLHSRIMELERQVKQLKDAAYREGR